MKLSDVILLSGRRFLRMKQMSHFARRSKIIHTSRTQERGGYFIYIRRTRSTIRFSTADKYPLILACNTFPMINRRNEEAFLHDACVSRAYRLGFVTRELNGYYIITYC